MIINLTGRHVEITDALRAHVEERLRSAFADFPRLESAHVVLNLEKHRHIAEIDVRGPHHLRVEAREETHDMYEAFDRVVEKALKQMRRWADKVHEHKGVGLGRIESAVARQSRRSS